MAASPDPSRPPEPGVPPDEAEARRAMAPSSCPPALWAGFSDPTRWHDVLEGYARSTQLAVALVDPTGRLLGQCRNPQPVWSLVRAAQPAGAGASVLSVPRAALHGARRRPAHRAARADAGSGRVGPCGGAALRGGECLAVLLAGQGFDQFPESLPLDRLARACGVAPHPLWQLGPPAAPRRPRAPPGLQRAPGHLRPGRPPGPLRRPPGTAAGGRHARPQPGGGGPHRGPRPRDGRPQRLERGRSVPSILPCWAA